MTTRGEKHALPAHLASSETARYDRVVPPPGPWMEDVWVVVRTAGDYRRTATEECSVLSCGQGLYKVAQRLCHAHYWQWIRAGKPEPVSDWLPHANPPQKRRIERAAVDFRSVPTPLAQEIRFVVGTKITSGDWTPNRSILTLVRVLIETAERVGASSLLERRPEDWFLLVRDGGTPAVTAMDYMKTFFSTLHRSAVADPWAEDSWLWRHGFDTILGNAHDAYKQNIHWGQISQPWLREPAKRLAKKRLVAKSRSWGTVVSWVRALKHLSEYMAAEGVDDPSLVDRDLFLDYMANTRESGASKNALMGVNTAATLLSDLRQGGYLPELGSEVYLRHGENVVERAADPRPFPPDVVERIDRMLEDDPEIDEVVRVMLKFNRWGGLRVSELVSLPLDCMRSNHTGGVWVEYFMPKTRAWRRFPLPDDLAEMMRDQQRYVRRLFGRNAEFMFPSLNRSSRVAEVIRPWSTAGLRNHTYKAFVRNGITSSSITGERISGSSIHRFRHTIGTALLNNNMTQAEVAQFLGHLSQTMTSHYARITDDTLNQKVRDFHEQQRIDKPKPTDPQEHPTVEHLRSKFTAVLPDGYCQLPAGQHCDFRENPCKSCSFYDDGGEDFKAVHENHRRLLRLFVVGHKDDPPQAAINQANLDALNSRIPEPL